MCCDICPFFDECEELDELQEVCCRECPDFGDCQVEDRGSGDESESPTDSASCKLQAQAKRTGA
jgi:hypothetical protein